MKCPLPGTVLSVKVAVGDTVAAGQTLVVLEAMKMENNIDADRAGVVKQILVQQGATVMEGDVLIVIGEDYVECIDFQLQFRAGKP